MNCRKSILEEIVHKMPLCERALVCKYLRGEMARSDYEYERIRSLELAMQNETEHWWNSEYAQVRAYKQFYCSTLILNFDMYKQDVQKLLRRKVNASELFDRITIADEITERYLEWEKTIA